MKGPQPVTLTPLGWAVLAALFVLAMCFQPWITP